MNVTEEQETAIVDLVRRVAKSEIMPRFRKLAPEDISTKTSIEDLVTEADVNSERVIAAEISEMLPDALIVGEEATEINPGLLDEIAEAPLSVIIDPVDGTWNFAKGLATFGVIVAVAEKGEAVFGVLYDPVLDDWIWARKGGGAWYSNAAGVTRRLRLDQRAPDVLTGAVPVFQFPESVRHDLVAENAKLRRIWSVRCSCHEYRMLAGDQIDFVVTQSLKPWDHAAGTLAVTEAGGAVGLLDGRDYRASIFSGGQLVAARSEEVLNSIRQSLNPIVNGRSKMNS